MENHFLVGGLLVKGGPFLGFLARFTFHVSSEIYVIDGSKNLLPTAEHGLACANFINHKSHKLNRRCKCDFEPVYLSSLEKPTFN